MTNINNIISKYQSGKFEYDENQDRAFISLKDYSIKFGDIKTTIQAIYINKESKFGDAPVFYTENYMVNMPQHLTKLATDLRQDDEVVEAINNRQLAFEVYTYNGKNGMGYSINLVPSDDNAEDTKGRAFNTDDNTTS